jgi:branched-chain amino acid transport system substrate-binding protein
MRSRKLIVLGLVFVMIAGMFAGCGGNGGTEDPGTATPERDYILIGIPNPSTGPIASFGEGTPWAEELAIKTINDAGGIYIEEYDMKMPIRLKFVDTESDPTKASEVTQKLIVDDKVDMLISRHTPDTALPVSAMAERYGVPTVSLECPIDAWLSGGPYEWAFHSFWSIDTVYTTFSQTWKDLGFGNGTKVGILMPNDPDGLAWLPIFQERLAADGFVVSDPGRYPNMNSDWTAIINKFKADGVEIVTGVNIPPDFANFAIQSKQLGFEPKLTSMGKSYLFSSDANALGVDIAEGLTAEVWWSPFHPYKSSLTGQTPAEILDLYTAQSGRTWTAPIGYKYAGLEIAIDVLTRAASLDPEKIRDAIAATDMTTVVGPIKYNDQHISETPLVMGQWFLNATGDMVELKIINSLYPEIPVNGQAFLK